MANKQKAKINKLKEAALRYLQYLMVSILYYIFTLELLSIPHTGKEKKKRKKSVVHPLPLNQPPFPNPRHLQVSLRPPPISEAPTRYYLARGIV
jgi:hypothetical protein